MPIKSYILKITFLFFSLLVLTVNSQAAVIEDLYDAKIPVSDQSDKTQKSAFTQALRLVLVKVRGNKDLLRNAQIRKAIGRSTRLVRSYSYEKEQNQLYLLVNFDQSKIDTAIRSAGYPVWDKRRPDSLVWLAIEQDGKSTKELLTIDNAEALHQQLTLTAKDRGIELVFPLWDLDDRQALNEYDVWGGFSQQIANASERYGVPSILSSRIYIPDESSDLEVDAPRVTTKKRAQKDLWVGDWTMIEGSKISSGQVYGSDPDEVGQKLIHGLADVLSEKYAVDLASINPEDAKTQVVITNINSLKKYVDVLNFLESLSVVNNATLIIQQGPQATYELALLGDVDDLKNAINLDEKIKPIVDEFGQPIAELEFVWAGNE